MTSASKSHHVQPCNVAIVCGVVTRATHVRTLPSGQEVAEFDLTGDIDARPSLSVPVSVTDPSPAVLGLDAGVAVVVIGRVARRFYRSGGATLSRTEIVADQVVPQRLRKRVEKAITAATAKLDPHA